MDKIFKALSDNHRIIILDALKDKDGQTLTEIEKILNDLSRFGVMKHLKVLEKVSLISSRKEGRFKYHYLNPVPIQEIADRWISRFAAPWAQNMIDIKTQIERTNNMNNKPKHVFTTIIQTSTENLWKALITSEKTQQYFFGLKVKSALEKDAKIIYLKEDGSSEIEGTIIEIIPFKKLVHTFCANHCSDGKKDAPSRVTYEIEEIGSACKLTLIHDNFEGETESYKSTGHGWPIVISGLKTLLETGKPLSMDVA